ncbi:BLUF domain-containing protein [Bacillus subtilis subsp. subtilis]|nr:BLUF domain-containing protein [Bacillus subtilis subsp. subtilis]
MPLRAIAYVSEASAGLSSTTLDALVADASRFNTVAGVTGVLLFDGGRFLQYFEGPEDGVAGVHERILQARSHHAIVELSRGRVPQRYFPYWGMRWLAVEPVLIRQLSAGDWAGFARRVQGTPAVDSGLDQLLDLLTRTLPGPHAVHAAG